MNTLPPSAQICPLSGSRAGLEPPAGSLWQPTNTRTVSARDFLLLPSDHAATSETLVATREARQG